jgi:hypothetical protein
MKALGSLPSEVTVRGRGFYIQEAEGMVTFFESSPICAHGTRLVFRRDSENGWSVEIASQAGSDVRRECEIGLIFGAYRIIEKEYGGIWGGTLTCDGRSRGPYGTKMSGWVPPND